MQCGWRALLRQRLAASRRRNGVTNAAAMRERVARHADGAAAKRWQRCAMGRSGDCRKLMAGSIAERAPLPSNAQTRRCAGGQSGSWKRKDPDRKRQLKVKRSSLHVFSRFVPVSAQARLAARAARGGPECLAQARLAPAAAACWRWRRALLAAWRKPTSRASRKQSAGADQRPPAPAQAPGTVNIAN